LPGRAAVLEWFSCLYPVLGEVRVVEHYINIDRAAGGCSDSATSMCAPGNGPVRRYAGRPHPRTGESLRSTTGPGGVGRVDDIAGAFQQERRYCSMGIRFAYTFLRLILMAHLSFAVENPFLGTWKLNTAKSKFTGETISYEQTPWGEIRFTAPIGQSYTFKTDGREYNGLLNDKVRWTQVDEKTWTMTPVRNGKPLGTATITLSPDGNTMASTFSGTKPTGAPFEEITIYERLSRTSGLIGKWRSKEVKISSPNTFVIEPNGEDGLTLKLVEINASCSAKFDGKDYPGTGPTVPPNFTIAIERPGPREFKWTFKANGKAISQSTFTVSEDGNTMTERGGPIKAEELHTAVYERQR
jgi:hypothetical protein